MSSLSNAAGASSIRFSGTAPLVLDGSLADWDAAGIAPIPIASECPLFADNPSAGMPQAMFRIAVDRENMYLAIAATYDTAPSGLTGGRQTLADVEFYGGASLAAAKYKKNRGIDALVRITARDVSGEGLDGSLRVPQGADRTAMIEFPGLWHLLGARGAAVVTEAGFTAEVAIPKRAVAWSGPADPLHPLFLNVRVFAHDKTGARIAAQWADDPEGTSEYSHEMLGAVSFAKSVSTEYLAPAGNATSDTAWSAIAELGAGNATQAAALLTASSDPGLQPLLALAYERAGKHEMSRAVLRDLASQPGPMQKWALEGRDRSAERPVLRVNTGDLELDHLSDHASLLAKAGRWAEALPVFRSIAERSFIPPRLKTWASVQVQRGLQAIGDTPGSIAAGLEIQETAADGDPNRRASFNLLTETYYAAGEDLKRLRAAVEERSHPVPLHTLVAARLNSRHGAIGCRQALELGELERVEGAIAQAMERFAAINGRASCPGEERAWSLVLLQRAQIQPGRDADAIETMSRINSEFPDEWDIRGTSLLEARRIVSSKSEVESYQRTLSKFQQDLTAAISGGTPIEAERARVLLAALAGSQPGRSSSAGLKLEAK